MEWDKEGCREGEQQCCGVGGRQFMVMLSFLHIFFALALIVVFVYTSFIEEKKGRFKRGEIRRKSVLSHMMKENVSLITTFSNWFEIVSNIVRYFGFLCIYIYLGIIIFVMIVKPDTKVFDQFQKIVFEYGFEGILLSLNGITITAIIFLATLSPKQYYLLFTKEDVIKNYKFDKIFSLISLTSVISVVLYFILSRDVKDSMQLWLMGIYFYLMLLNVILNFIALVNVSKIGFSSGKIEFKMLTKLNDIFNNNSWLPVIKQTDGSIMLQNLSFLLNDYQLLTNKKKLSGILKCRKSSFCSFYDNESVLMKAKEKFSVIFIVHTGVLVKYIKDVGHCNHIVIISILINIIMVLFINSNWRKEYIEQYTLSFVYPNFGYLFECEDSEGSYEEYVGYYAMFKKNNFDKYIIKSKNIMAFYCIVCNSMATEQSNEFIKVDVVDKLFEEALLALDENLIEENRWKDFMIKLPIITSSYFYYLKLKRLPISISLYMKNFTDEETMRMCSMMKAFITDVSRNRVLESSLGSVKMRYKSLEELEQDIIATGFFKILTKKEGLLL